MLMCINFAVLNNLFKKLEKNEKCNKNSKVYCIHDSMTEIYISKIIIPTQIIFAPSENDP